jgi:hypothetical protein
MTTCRFARPLGAYSAILRSGQVVDAEAKRIASRSVNPVDDYFENNVISIHKESPLVDVGSLIAPYTYIGGT